MSKALCIIPARGGSKRIPRKNIKEFHGKPIIAYSIDTALKSELFEEVMVSTDCEEIKKISHKYGAKVPFLRSPVNSNDTASTIDVVNEVLQQYRKRYNYTFDKVCVVYPTAPLIDTEDIIKGYKMLDCAQAVLPVVRFDYPVFRGFVADGDNIRYNWPEFANKRSQDISNLYHDCGQWYWFRNNDEIHESVIKPITKAIFKNSLDVQDIDTEEDWKLAEIKFKLKRNA